MVHMRKRDGREAGQGEHRLIRWRDGEVAHFPGQEGNHLMHDLFLRLDIPAKREEIKGVRYSYRGMKIKEEHIVPLSRQEMVLLEQLKQISGDKKLLFPGDHDATKVMSVNTVDSALRAMGYDTKTEVCGHGFRTMARGSMGESGLWSDDAI